MIVALVGGCVGAMQDEEATTEQSVRRENKCKPDKPGEPAKPGKPDKPGKRCVVTSAAIGVEGGSIVTPDGVILDVPFGAVAEEIVLTITRTTLDAPGALSDVYMFEPAGTVFARPVVVALPMPAGVSAASVYWSRLDAPGYDAIGGEIVGDRIVTTTGHFSEGYVGPASSTRTVNGLYVRTWISASTRVDEPLDFSVHDAEAFVDDNGTYMVFPGQAGAPGTFSIPNVPEGEYVLHTQNEVGDVYVVTSTNTPDLGSALGGRPLASRTEITASTTLSLELSNLVGWQDTDQLELFGTESDIWSFDLHNRATPAIEPGDTTASVDFDLLDGSFGFPYRASEIVGASDRVIVAQLSERSTPTTTYKALSRLKQLEPFDLGNGGTYETAVALDDVSLDNQVQVDYRGTQFAAELAIDDHPWATNSCLICGGFVAVLGQAGFAKDGFYTANADLLILEDKAPAGTDVVSGPMSYGSTTSLPGQWGELFLARYTRRLVLRLPDTSAPALLFTGYDWVTTVAAGGGTPLVPLLTQPRAIAVDGVDGFTGANTISATPTISWQPPRIGTPDLYLIVVIELFVDANNGTARRPLAQVVTPHTSFRFPPGLIDPAKAYAFNVLAIAATTPEARSALLAQPLRAGLHQVMAGALTNIFGGVRGTPPRDSVVAGGLTDPTGIVSDGSAIYWGEAGNAAAFDGNIWRANLDGSNPEILVAGQGRPQKLAVDGNTLYWTTADDGTLHRFDLVGGFELPPIVSGEPYLGDVVARDGSVYWFAAGLWALRAGETVPAVVDWVNGVNLDTDGVNLYWTEYGDAAPGATGRVLAISVGGGPTTVLAQNQPQAWDVHSDGTHVYWSNQAWEQSFPASISRVHATGGTSTTLATGDQIMKTFGIDGTHAYWVDGWQLFSVPLAGGAPTLIAPLFEGGCPEHDLVIAGGAAFWTDTCTASVVRVQL